MEQLHYITLLKALGYNPLFPHANQMSGGNYELFSFAYIFNSDNCAFSNLIFDSATQDNAHAFGFAINAKGKAVLENTGAGLAAQATGNSVSNIEIYDFVMGLMISGQDSMTVMNVTTDRRASTLNTAPGHVLYAAPSLSWNAEALKPKLPLNDPNVITTWLFNTQLTVKNITEGPHTYSLVHAGGTFAIKGVHGGLIDTVQSQYPLGLLQTLAYDEDVVFSNMKWERLISTCSIVPDLCGTSVINSYWGPTANETISNLTFTNITLISKFDPITVGFMGDHLRIDGLSVQTLPNWLPGGYQTNTLAAISTKHATDAILQNVIYMPILTQYPANHYNLPFQAWIPSSNVTLDMQIQWPSAVQVPKPGSEIITARSQTSDTNNELNVTMMATP